MSTPLNAQLIHPGLSIFNRGLGIIVCVCLCQSAAKKNSWHVSVEKEEN
jgi:hypothetical protein